MGNTMTTGDPTNDYKDHPHIHGEYIFILVVLTLVIGSPPHTWGIHDEFRPIDREARITPTYMGNTDNCYPGEQFGRDHPHIHGEY